MIMHKVTPFLTVILTIFSVQTKSTAQNTNSASWNVVEENGKQYIPVSDIEKFYQFKGGFYTQKPPSYRMFHTNLELGFQYETNAFLFNKIPITAFEPMIKQNKALLISVQDLSSIVNPVLNPQRIKCQRISQIVMGFTGASNQPEPAFYSSSIQSNGFLRVDSLTPGTGGLVIKINRQPMVEGKKSSHIIWTYESDASKVGDNHRNVALATSMSAHFKGFKNVDVGPVLATKKTATSGSDLTINLAVEAVDEEPFWTAVLQSIRKFNNALGR